MLAFPLNHILYAATCFTTLLQNGCDVNSQSYSGNTALHSACGRDQADTVRLLLKNGADSSLKNYHNDTPVMVTKNKKVSENLHILIILSSRIPLDFLPHLHISAGMP